MENGNMNKIIRIIRIKNEASKPETYESEAHM